MSNSTVYSSPVLYDQSETITEALTLHSKRKKHLVIYDQKAVEDIKQFIDKHEEEELEAMEIGDSIHLQDVRVLLYSQKMGTQLYIAAEWDHAVTIFDEAVEAGFTEDEIQVMIYGPTKRYVYCVKCYNTSETTYDETVQCPYCSAHMEVGPFFSKVRKGYIGYPFNPTYQQR
ncbi:dimethylamine monooxygenase subunit DmmA family protein [Siminovitchia sediminis]|uniref:Dimethylamine monooxygenase subunit DmmA family protein n=1 Tax=Siminovitchia sediminis TaxID=1274353 RepID=A0ABW4KJQ3_9BACI